MLSMIGFWPGLVSDWTNPMTDSAHPHFPRRRSPPPPTLIQYTMGLIRRHSVIAFIGILVTVMLLVTQLKALPGQQIVMRADQMSCEDARKLDLTKMTMAEFKPEMVVGLYFVQDENDVMFAKLSGEKKPVRCI